VALRLQTLKQISLMSCLLSRKMLLCWEQLDNPR